MDFEFGDKVVVANKLIRKTDYNDSTRHVSKFWEERAIPRSDGIYLGKRTLNNGKRSWYSDHIEYYPQEYIEVSLVAINGRTNPFYSTDITIKEEQ